MIRASIITIGDELLIGQVIDTNSAWIARMLNGVGIPVVRRIAVGDNRESIVDALESESQTADLILMTGGLGPTADDITKPLLNEYFGGELVNIEPVERHLEQLFAEVLKRPLTERNRQQALLPDVCEPLFNRLGTAPGMWFEREGKSYISLPGVPAEMKALMEEEVLPRLIKKWEITPIEHRTLVTFGVGESVLADQLIDFEKELPKPLSLAYLPNHGLVRLRLTDRSGKAADLLDAQFEKLNQNLGNQVIVTEDKTMEEIVGQRLLTNNQTVATAESCTGGYIAHLLSRIPGASRYYEGSMVTYSYQAKEDMLGVSHETLLQHGAVSEAVVREMAQGLLKHTTADFTIAVSGILGPSGGLPDKPVGTVWMAVGHRTQTFSRKHQFRFDRAKNIELTAMYALNFLREVMGQGLSN
jgi:nicotinamide-nucleotide amidase